MSESCDRCGESAGAIDGLCENCKRWISEQGKLTDENVLEAVQFGKSPVASPDRIVLAIGGVAVPLILSLFAITYPLIDVYDDAFNQHIASAPLGPVLVAFGAVLTSLVTVLTCAALARRWPWAASLAAASVSGVMAITLIVVASMKLPAHTIVFVRMSSTPFTLAGILSLIAVLQVIVVLALGLPLYLADARRRQLAHARQRLTLSAGQCPP